MADSTISQLPTALSVSTADYFAVDQSGVTKKASLSMIGLGSVFLASGKTLTISNTLTFAGTDGTTVTFPTTDATVARTDAGQTFTGTQVFGALTCTTINGGTISFVALTCTTINGGTIAFVAGKTFTANNTITIAGTDGTTITFPTTSATMARTDAAQTFTGVQTFSSTIVGSVSGSAATLTTARTIDGVSFDGSANITVVAPATHAATNKTTPVSADEFPIYDSVSGLLNHVTYANLATTLSTTSPRSAIFSVEASTAASALTVTLNATTILDFRSTTMTTGVPNTRTVSGDISVVVSSGSTLGTVSGVESRIIVVAIDNSGTVELAVINLSGGNNLDETTLISTTAEGGAGAADSANVFYSTTARSNVPFRIVGYVDSTQTTAGTWAQTLTVQGAGGNALTAMSSFGYGQTWQTVTRTSGTTYYNVTGKPIAFLVVAASATTADMVVGSYSFTTIGGGGITLDYGPFIIPPNSSYSYTQSGGSYTASELR